MRLNTNFSNVFGYSNPSFFNRGSPSPNHQSDTTHRESSQSPSDPSIGFSHSPAHALVAANNSTNYSPLSAGTLCISHHNLPIHHLHHHNSPWEHLYHILISTAIRSAESSGPGSTWNTNWNNRWYRSRMRSWVCSARSVVLWVCVEGKVS